jgi:hypothetical protein
MGKLRMSGPGKTPGQTSAILKSIEFGLFAFAGLWETWNDLKPKAYRNVLDSTHDSERNYHSDS